MIPPCLLSTTFTTTGVTIASGATVSVFLDTDILIVNGTVESAEFSRPGGATARHSFNIAGLPAGQYYYFSSAPSASAVGFGGPTHIGCGTALTVTLSPAALN